MNKEIDKQVKRAIGHFVRIAQKNKRIYVEGIK